MLLIPIGLYLVSTLVLLALRWLRPKFSYSWLVAALTALVSWGMILFLRVRLPQSMILGSWQPLDTFQWSIVISLDTISWVLAASLSTLVLAVILTATARSQSNSDSVAWISSLLFGGLGIASVVAGNPATLLTSWTALDLLELGILIGSVQTANLSQRTILSFAARTAGTLSVVWGLVNTTPSVPGSGFESITITSGIFFLVGAALRLGVLPLHLPYSSEPRTRRGIGTLLRLVPAASSLMLLARIPANTIPDAWSPVLITFSAFAAIYAALMWITAPDEIEGRPFWIIGLSALAVTCAIRGSSFGVLAWSVVLLLPGGFLFLFSARGSRLAFLWGAVLLIITGLPYTLTANGWTGLIEASPLPGIGPVFLVSYVLLLTGYARHAIHPGDSLVDKEPWVRGIYPLGLSTFPVVLVILGLFGWRGSRIVGDWWVGGGITILLGGLLVVRLLAPNRYRQVLGSPLFNWISPLLLGILKGIAALFRFDWLYTFIWVVLNAFGNFLNLLSGIFEGDAGVLWAVLLLTLVISIIQVGQ